MTAYQHNLSAVHPFMNKTLQSNIRHITTNIYNTNLKCLNILQLPLIRLREDLYTVYRVDIKLYSDYMKINLQTNSMALSSQVNY
jgi:hypothetical protein